MGTIIVGIVVLAIIVCAIYFSFHKSKRGGCPGCSGCSQEQSPKSNCCSDKPSDLAK